MRLLAALLMAGAGSAFAQPRFVEVAADLGIEHQYTGGWEHFVGGGVATFDCDGDALPEIYAAGGSAKSMLLRNVSTSEALEFRPDTPEALAVTDVTGAYPIDIDSDGQLDLVILRVGENLLMRGLPECQFEPFQFGLPVSDRWTTAFSATWERGNRLPTLAFGNYVDRTDPEGPFEACDVNLLYRPHSDGYAAPMDLEPGYCALSMLFSDWSRSGRADLRISNDRHYYVRDGSEQLWKLGEELALYGEQDGWRETSIWGMGIASRDITDDAASDLPCL